MKTINKRLKKETLSESLKTTEQQFQSQLVLLYFASLSKSTRGGNKA